MTLQTSQCLDKVFEAFEKRYPQLLFLLTLDHEPFKLETKSFLNAYHETTNEAIFDPKTFSKEVERFEALLQSSSEAETLVVFGLGLGAFYKLSKAFLDGASKRDLVFIEKDIWKVKAFLQTPGAEEFLSHPQVHLRLILDMENLSTAFDEITEEFPVESMLVTAIDSFKEGCDFEKVKELFLRRAVISSSMYKEGFFSHRLFENFFPNYVQLGKSRSIENLKAQFKDIPAVICGAGPSLDSSIKHLKQLKNKALIIAGGSTITALSRQGVDVDFRFAVDPNEEEYERLKHATSFQSPLIYATRVYPKIFRFFNGELGYFRTCTGGAFERSVEEKLGIEKEPFHKGMKDEGLSVTVLCLSTAIAMGCNPIFLVGVDLAFVNNKCYADKVVLDNEVFEKDHLGRDLKISKKNSLGKDVETSLKWVMESEVMSEFAKLHSSTKVYDCVSEGLGFEGIEKCPASKIIEKCENSYDLSAMVHQRLLSLGHLSDHKTELYSYLNELKDSFSTCLSLTNQILTRASQIEGDAFDEDPFDLTLSTRDGRRVSRSVLSMFFKRKY